jgi:uncharacterized membrane protein required for colicin V production
MVNLNLVDIIIIVFILSGVAIGWKRGATKQLVSCLGLILVVVLSFFLKNPVSVFLYEHLPFFKFGGILKGVTVLNILLYEVIAFLVVFTILMVALKVLMLATTLFEAILKATIVLGIPSKLLGALIGIIEYFVITFIILYVLMLPMFHIKAVQESKYANTILKSTPILSNMVNSSMKVIDEFASLKEKYEVAESATEFNLETLDLFLKYDIVKLSSVDRLIEKNQLVIDNVDSVLNKYRKEATE